MNRQIGLAAMGVTLALAGCATNGQKQESGAGGDRAPAVSAAPQATEKEAASTRPLAAAKGEDVVATVNGQRITMAELQEPLMKAYGLNVLLNLVQLDLAKQAAAKDAQIVKPADIQKEYERTVDPLFSQTQSKTQSDLEEAEAKKDAAKAAELREDLHREKERLLDQVLAQQHMSRAEFMLVVEASAYLRKIAESQMPTLTEKNLEDGWKAQYGEKVVVRHIQVANLQEVAAARAKLAGGESFQQVAREMSRNEQTRRLGGELPAFTMSNTNVPEEFKKVAFGLKVGEVSDPVQAEGSYHLLELVRRIAPKAVKFEDVKEAVREELTERWVQNRVNELRKQLGAVALKGLVIENPTLRQQFEDRIAQSNGEIKSRDRIKREIERQREEHEATTRAIGGADQRLFPATAPTTGQASVPAEAEGHEPATQRIEPQTTPQVHITTTAPTTKEK